MVDIIFSCGDENLIDKIKPLWKELNKYLLGVSPHFKEYYKTLTFESRKRFILQRATGGAIRVDLAFEDCRLAGDCVSSIDKLLTGEIDSIFVNTNYRRQGIGRALIEKALIWLDEEDVKKKIISVTVGNEQVYAFYQRFGFLPRRILLEQKK